MKGLSIEQKAKRYDEALEKSKRLYEQGTITESLCYVFPELKKSEDEKTRKRIIALVNAHGQGMYKDDMLAWLENIPYTIDHEKREGFHLGYKAALEKQGMSYTKKDVDDAYLKGISDAKNELEKQGERKTWSEEDEKEYKYVLKFVDNILNNCGNKKDYEHCKRCYDWLKSLKQRIGGKL